MFHAQPRSRKPLDICQNQQTRPTRANMCLAQQMRPLRVGNLPLCRSSRRANSRTSFERKFTVLGQKSFARNNTRAISLTSVARSRCYFPRCENNWTCERTRRYSEFNVRTMPALTASVLILHEDWRLSIAAQIRCGAVG